MELDRRTLLAALMAATLPPLATRAEASEAVEAMLDLPSGMRLDGNEQIGMLMYPGFTALDLIGPYHSLASMPGATVHLVTNQRDLSPVPSDLGVAMQPTVTMDDCPRDLTVLFTPGGTAGTLAAARDGATLEFIRDRAKRAVYVTSVCTGSLVLGAAGVLNGKRATSHWSVRPLLSEFGATPVDSRVVVDGNVITGAGVSAGLDLGLSLVAQLRGKPFAESVLLVAEYDPEPPFPGGSLHTARPEIAAFTASTLEGFVADARKLGVAG
ncbi:MAG: DJ-1/PfpI family protein [Rhizobiaceae bacterium]|nr:DJ-1/PfpI family protein [Rhizobiaceae bacterium]